MRAGGANGGVKSREGVGWWKDKRSNGGKREEEDRIPRGWLGYCNAGFGGRASGGIEESGRTWYTNKRKTKRCVGCMQKRRD